MLAIVKAATLNDLVVVRADGILHVDRDDNVLDYGKVAMEIRVLRDKPPTPLALAIKNYDPSRTDDEARAAAELITQMPLRGECHRISEYLKKHHGLKKIRILKPKLPIEIASCAGRKLETINIYMDESYDLPFKITAVYSLEGKYPCGFGLSDEEIEAGNNFASLLLRDLGLKRPKGRKIIDSVWRLRNKGLTVKSCVSRKELLVAAVDEMVKTPRARHHLRLIITPHNKERG